jgi:hypothetical protein
MKPSEAPIKQPFVKRDFSPKKVLPILCPTCKKSVAACYDTIKNEVPKMQIKMNNMKIAYKKIRAIARSPRKVELINLIINLKSNYAGSIYSNIFIREQMRHLLRGTKSWSGDVLYYFLQRFDAMVKQPRDIRGYYSVSKSDY